MRRTFIGLAILIGLPLSTSLVAAPAMAQVTPSVEVSSATLVARGAAADFHLTVSCVVGSVPFINLSVVQRAGNKVTQAFGSASFTCEAETQSLTVTATVQAGLPALKPAEALVQGGMQNPDLTFVPIHETLKLAKK